MTKIQIELPDATAQAADYLLSVADEVASAGVAPMSMEKINAGVKAARAGAQGVCGHSAHCRHRGAATNQQPETSISGKTHAP